MYFFIAFQFFIHFAYCVPRREGTVCNLQNIIASRKKNFQGAESVLKFNSNISIYIHKVWNEVRLVGRPSAGVLELKQNDGSWSKVCGDEFWTQEAAGVACHNLGFDRAYKPRTRVRRIPNSIISLLFLTIFNRNILLKINIFQTIQQKDNRYSRLHCEGSETSIGHCKVSTGIYDRL